MNNVAAAVVKSHFMPRIVRSDLEQRIKQLEIRVAAQQEMIDRLLSVPRTGTLKARRLNAADIRLLICREYGMSIPEFDSPMRNKILVSCRRRAFYLATRHTGLSSVIIGRAFNRDRTSIIYQYKYVTRLRAEDPEEDAELSRLERLLGV